MKSSPIIAALLCSLVISPAAAGPYERQIAEQVARLDAESSPVRAGAAEALGLLRAYSAETALVARLDDPVPEVRRQAAAALAFCGSRKSVDPLLEALADRDWLVRQSAQVALTNLTAQEFPFDATAATEKQIAQAKAWRDWRSTVPVDRLPAELLATLDDGRPRPTGRRVRTSSLYRGPAESLIDGRIGPEFWQTKNVPAPQWCEIDLGRDEEIGRVVVHQYGPGFVMTGYEVSAGTSRDAMEIVARGDRQTPVRLVVTFPRRKARFVRITSRGARNRSYPTTFFEVEIDDGRRPLADDSDAWRRERAARALGALGGEGATAAILKMFDPQPSTRAEDRPTVRAAIRSLGRLNDEAGFQTLLRLLDDPLYARYAAEALGDCGDVRAVRPLLAVYARYAKTLSGRDPRDVPHDDRMSFPSEDRMLETPYWIAFALCRLPLDAAEDRLALRAVAPQIMANLPGDHDTFMLYEPEGACLLTRHLLEAAGLRQEACEQAMLTCGQPRRTTLVAPLQWSQFPAHRMASWLPCVCTEKADVSRLLALLEHENGWVSLNAAKTLAWIGDRRAVEPVAELLRRSKAEADYGYSGRFKDEEYADPAPRRREGLVRALGLLDAHEHVGLLIGVLDDERSVVDVRHAAAWALDDLGGPEAIAALRRAAVEHSFFCVRHTARDALRRRGLDVDSAVERLSPAASRASRSSDLPQSLDQVESIVFVQGDNDIPNTKGTVEQADRWRQTYAVTDSGPVYRPGRNLFTLSPPRPDGKLTPLTNFKDGYVGEPEVTYDGRHVLFTRRRQDDPWWHVWRIGVDGRGLTQLTFGPYHDTAPCELPDGRIVFSSTRSGIRDEYHGYPCNVLCTMQTDGSRILPIATNIGRDNEPAVLHDGRIVFSRLEVFYSRNKTELTLHAARPDGTQDVVLYGPERRKFWRDLNHGPRTPADDSEAPLTHRVLRMTQPQPMPDRRNVVVVTQGGLTLVGPRRDTEEIITPDNQTRAYTTPMPLPDGTILCAATEKTPDRKQVDLGLYLFDPSTKDLRPIFNDPSRADFEARPIMARERPPVRTTQVRTGAYSGELICMSAFDTQEPKVAPRGRWVRLIEGVPVVGRHSTQTNPQPVWKNHGGTLGRILGTAPLADDGSFYVEAPADRLLHFQILDADRRVVGNQLTWIYARPSERKSCVGCHEKPHTTTAAVRALPLAGRRPPLEFLPRGDELKFRAKAWFKGSLPEKIEDRAKTVRAVNLLAR